MKLVSKIFKREDWSLTSPFGTRKPIETKNGKTGNFHYGCDYGTNGEKWKQYALEDGYIMSCGKDNYGANYVWVAYPRLNIKLLHYHLDSVNVKVGQKVDENTIIGYTGETGRATGIHLHLGMKFIDGGDYIDPHTYEYNVSNSIVNNNNQKLLKIGDEVIANGSLYLSSDASKSSGYINNKKTIITRYVPNAKHPYNTTGDLGWMNSCDLRLICEKKENVYIVKSGDTLYGIAQKYYGNGNLYKKIANYNNIKNPDIIYIGQELIIP